MHTNQEQNRDSVVAGIWRLREGYLVDFKVYCEQYYLQWLKYHQYKLIDYAHFAELSLETYF